MDRVPVEKTVLAIAELSGKTKSQVIDVLDALAQFVISTAKSGSGVRISGLGTFVPKQRAAYIGQNPATKEKIEVPAKRVLDFNALPSVKEL